MDHEYECLATKVDDFEDAKFKVTNNFSDLTDFYNHLDLTEFCPKPKIPNPNDTFEDHLTMEDAILNAELIDPILEEIRIREYKKPLRERFVDCDIVAEAHQKLAEVKK